MKDRYFLATMEIFGMIISVLLLLGVVALVAFYKAFVARRNRMRQAFSAVDVHLKRRWELVPTLVQTVQGYADNERRTLEKVIHARNAARDARSASRERFLQEKKVGSGLEHLFVVAEKYPELEENEQFQGLQRQLAEIDRQIVGARQAYNESVKDWNGGVESFPGTLFAGRTGFERAERFEPLSEEREFQDAAAAS